MKVLYDRNEFHIHVGAPDRPPAFHILTWLIKCHLHYSTQIFCTADPDVPLESSSIDFLSIPRAGKVLLEFTRLFQKESQTKTMRGGKKWKKQ